MRSGHRRPPSACNPHRAASTAAPAAPISCIRSRTHHVQADPADRKRRDASEGQGGGGWTLALARSDASAPKTPMRYSGSFVPQAGAGSALPQAGAGSALPQAGAGFGSALPQAVPQAGAGSVVPQPPDTTLSRLLMFVSFLSGRLLSGRL